ncbi:terminase small subunit [Thomasclavelia cocleata]|uniref:terminase small subunit n=3 Tax=Thomasclavelia cocleata TaxID=69824 RepID=UPI00255B1487|nr:terminase small subunit [Thomasclavelia cocleata]
MKEKHELAYEDYLLGMKRKDIAEKYGVSVNTVKSWATRHKWSKKGAPQKKRVQAKKGASKIAEKMINENGELDEDKQLFCIYYLKYFNATKAYMKVKPETPYASASVIGCRWYNLPEVQEEIKRLKKEMCAEALIDPVEIVQKYIDMAFYDVTDYAEFKGGVVLLKDSSCVDGTLIQEIKQGKEGVAVKFVDRSKALDWLSKHMNLATEEQKAKIDLIKAQTQKITGDEDTETIDDGFMDALNGTAKEDWDGYEED